MQKRAGIGKRLLALASAERGALLWMPGFLVGAWLLLFGLRLAPLGLSMFTRTTAQRVVVGPCTGAGASPTETAAFTAALRRGLAARGEIAVVDSVRVAKRLAVLTAPAGTAPDAEDFLRVIRPLNAHLGLCLALQRDPGALHARVEAFDAHAGRRLVSLTAEGDEAASMGHALAESLYACLRGPTGPWSAVHQ